MKSICIKLIIAILLFLGVNTHSLNAQEFSTWDMGIHTGLYLPSKRHAAFYNGQEQNDNKISFILNNQFRHNEIMNLLNASDTFLLGDLPTNMKYNPALQIGIYFRKTFNNYTGLSLQFNYSKLTASDIFTLEVDPLGIATLPDIRLFEIVGVEERVNIDVLFSKYFKSKNPNFIPFMEAGLNINSTRVKENMIRIEGQSYSLVNNLLNQSYVPGTQQTPYVVQQGGVGLGFALGGGLRIIHNDQVSIDPGFMLYLQRVDLPPYDTYNIGAVFFVRLSLANFLGQEGTSYE